MPTQLRFAPTELRYPLRPRVPWPRTNLQHLRRAIAFAANELGVSVQDLKKRGNAPMICGPRHQAMYLVRILSGASQPQIGRIFGFDHTTVLHALKKVEQARNFDEDLDQWIREATIKFRNGGGA